MISVALVPHPYRPSRCIQRRALSRRRVVSGVITLAGVGEQDVEARRDR